MELGTKHVKKERKKERKIDNRWTIKNEFETVICNPLRKKDKQKERKKERKKE